MTSVCFCFRILNEFIHRTPSLEEKKSQKDLQVTDAHLMPYNHKQNVFSASLNKTILSSFSFFQRNIANLQFDFVKKGSLDINVIIIGNSGQCVMVMVTCLSNGNNVVYV